MIGTEPLKGIQTWAPGDIFRIYRARGRIYWFQNDKEMHAFRPTSLSTEDLYIDVILEAKSDVVEVVDLRSDVEHTEVCASMVRPRASDNMMPQQTSLGAAVADISASNVNG